MSRAGLVCLFVFHLIAATAVALPAQDRPQAATSHQQPNQVFVKVILPVTSKTPKAKGPTVESWVAEQLKMLGETEFFAVTSWVPISDALLKDDFMDNKIWDGHLAGEARYCLAHGDIPERKEGRLLVRVAGWTPFGGAANIRLPDEPGSRAVGQVRWGRNDAEVDGKRTEGEVGLPYVAVIVAPPPLFPAKLREEGK
ncbi:MAG: hypothetical protein ACKOU6_05195 [Planctomycetota bacterium]